MPEGREPGTGVSARQMLEWPGAAVLGLLTWWYRAWPRWVPDLARLARSAEFRRVQSVSAGWLERNFELIERGAPWLERVGRWVCDRCCTSWRTGSGLTWFQFPRDPPEVGCRREITTVYGFDGSLPGRLDELAGALAGAGWGEAGHGGWAALRDLSRRQTPAYLPEPPVWPCQWAPVPALGVPAGLELHTIHSRRSDRGWLDMGLGWTSRGQHAELVTDRGSGEPGHRGLPGDPAIIQALGWPADLRTANAIYQPVEIGGTGIDDLTGRALERHEHAAAIRILIHYYPNVSTSRGRLRKRLRPVR